MLSRICQVATPTPIAVAIEAIFSKSIVSSKMYNAALRGEQRDATQFKPLCHKHKS
ncbi:hypothetical protein GTW36_25390 [Vibrio parahaemolyticus]|nr:hypothetical protein [Vibrio parahaemolyticus]